MISFQSRQAKNKFLGGLSNVRPHDISEGCNLNFFSIRALKHCAADARPGFLKHDLSQLQEVELQQVMTMWHVEKEAGKERGQNVSCVSRQGRFVSHMMWPGCRARSTAVFGSGWRQGPRS